MAQNECVATVCFWFHTWYIVTYWVTFTLVVMMLTSHPLFFTAFVFNQFMFVKFPYNITIPVYLNNVSLILITELCWTNAQRTHYIAAWQHFVRKTLQVFPCFYYVAVHVNQNSTNAAYWHNGIAAPCFFRIINCGPHWMYTWCSH